MANSYFRIRNFERFQHYKDRNPPWIRLYGALWRDRAFFRLPDAAKAHLIGLFSLAARLENRIPDDPEWIAHELCASEPIDLGAIVASGFLVPEPPASIAPPACQHPAPSSVSDSDLISAGSDPEIPSDNQDDPDNDQRSERDDRDAAAVPPPEDLDEAPRERRRVKRAETRWPQDFALDAQMREFATRLGIDAETEFDAWRDDCSAHDRRYADWRAAWRGRCRNALRFAGRGGPRARAGPGESAIDVALRRLREARAREQSGEQA
jgi:hypothetical protein